MKSEVLTEMERSETRAAIEAILFASAEPVPLSEIRSTLSDVDEAAIEAAIAEIEQRTEEQFEGIRLERIAGGLRFATRPELDPYLRKFFERKRETRLSMAALEVLAIVAYRQPVTAPEIAELRGVNSSGVLKTLLEKKLVRIAGRKNVVGSPFLYRTSREFLLHFGLERIQDLPSLEEFGELMGEGMDELGLSSEIEAAATDEVEAAEAREEQERELSEEDELRTEIAETGSDSPADAVDEEE